MITQFPNASANPLIETLRQAMEESSDGYEWLVVAHNDDRLVRSLYAALSHVPVFILETPQEKWNFRDGELAEAIEWAIQQTSLKHLALVGHSHAAAGGDADPSRSPLSQDESVEGGSGGYSRLRNGVTRTTARTRESQSSFAQQLEQLFAAPAVRKQSLDGDLAVYGLFFIAESEAFLSYEPDRKSFLPLIP